MLKIFLFLFILLTTKPVQAFTLIDTTVKYKSLKATKNNNSKNFYLNKGIKVWYKDGEIITKVKGYLSNITGDSVTIASFNRKAPKQQTVAITDIVAMSKIEIKQKRTLYTILTIALVLAIPSIIGLAVPTVFSYMLLIPVAVLILGVQYVLPIFYIIQSVSKVKVENGWKITAK